MPGLLIFDPSNPFNLPLLPPNLDLRAAPNFKELLDQHNKALHEISILKGAFSEIGHPEIFVSPFYLQEAISSSAVENIYTTLQSALEDETKIESERTAQNKEVLNYRDAIFAGTLSLNKFGLSSRTIRAVHGRLKVDRGVPGEYRQQQNSIVNRNSDGTSEVRYTPPPKTQIQNLIANWERYVNDDQGLTPLMRIAIAHYQFEALHPFEDGNGRTGRILMVLHLMKEGLLNHPALFLSGYLSRYKDVYKQLLLDVSKEGKWWDYIYFMLVGFEIQAVQTRIVLLQLKEERRKVRELLFNAGKKVIQKSNITSVVDHIFQYPVTTPVYMAGETKIHFQTCSKYLKHLHTEKILGHRSKGKRQFYWNKSAIAAFNTSNVATKHNMSN